MFKRDQNLLMILMLNLLYPAVLGSIFYSVLGNLRAITLGRSQTICLIMMASVMLFFSIDFLYTSMHERYSIPEFLVDIVILIAMFNAFDSINFLVHTPNPVRYCVCLGITFVIFVIWDIPRRHGIGAIFNKLISFEVFVALSFLSGALFDFPLGVVCGLSIFTSSVMVWLFRRIYKGHRSQLLEAQTQALPRAMPLQPVTLPEGTSGSQ